MTNPNVIIRHAATALDMMVTGAVRKIEDEYSSPGDPGCKAAITQLIDVLKGELDECSPAAPSAIDNTESHHGR